MAATYDRIADLPLQIAALERERRSLTVSSGFERVTSVIALVGPDGTRGLGEDVTYTTEDTDAALAAPAPDLAGRWTIRSFSARLAELELFPREPEMPSSRPYRRWAYESAALDLALRQADTSLAAVLAREVAPLRFVCSLRLGEPASLEPVHRRLAVHPWLRFKLDATPSWTDEIIAELAAMGAVDAVDFKGLYTGTVVDNPPDPQLYRRVAEGLPDAWLEDPALTDETGPVLEPHRDRVTWDANIHSIADVDALPFAPRTVNVKPSRFGSLEALCRCYDELAARGIGAYGGGQFELDVGRGQIQLLAALFHPDGSNDVAPLGFDELDPDPALPRSPLHLEVDEVGFRAQAPGPRRA